MTATEPSEHGTATRWRPAKPRLRPTHLVLSWLVGAAAIMAAAAVVPGVHVNGFGGALLTALLIGVLNAILPPLVAALRLPFMLVLGLLLDSLRRRGDALARVRDRPRRSSPSTRSGGRSLAALVASAVGVGARRASSGRTTTTRTRSEWSSAIARAFGRAASRPTCPGSCSSRSTGSRCPCCGARCATATRRRWRAGSPRTRTGCIEWETDLSSQTGASQAGHPARLERGHPGLPLGREGDRDVMTCSAPGRLRGDRAAARDRRRAARQRRREPRQPALRRGRRT